MKSLLIFGICFLVGAALAIGVRAAVHKPYAEATQVHDMAASPGFPAQPVSPGPKAGEAKPEQGDPHKDHGKAPAKTSGPNAAIGNTICPACGMEVDAELAAIPTSHGLVGIACPPCIPKIQREPDRYGAAARENRKAQ